MEKTIPLWLDVDPVCHHTRDHAIELMDSYCVKGHDDATAILLAIHLRVDNIDLLGVSTVHGNTTAEWTAINAARCLHAFAAPAHIKVYPGAARPLSRNAPKHCPEIHGEDGLAGVVGLSAPDSPDIQTRLARSDDSKPISALQGMTNAIRETWDGGAGRKVTIVSSGPMTNVAVFISAYPELLDGVEQFVFMGGGNGFGNITPAAEYNILCDPEAAQIVVNNPLKTVMLPINVTHTAIVNQGIHARLCSPHQHDHHMHDGTSESPATNLRKMLSSLVTYFGDTYREIFGFENGPPLHDALTIAYVSNPALFEGRRLHVDVETRGEHTTGATIVDTWNFRTYDDTWGPGGKNYFVLESLEVSPLDHCAIKSLNVFYYR
ncbi:Inosine/uridine-preferring nucleoside hydrolase domain-containing protein [Boletus reticuloceps]|uniref:Inosine/uridine-preferring nucleoside hydrolase domain-containing protein n=1 Tax=Boletus reticuloceps TaxID=495285 RepID=A0A8I2YK30_9AGAM|nr:Inosine/uridine-preferring nucleoside hydrolase domain-containing protein [Boletus reticuloceps]